MPRITYEKWQWLYINDFFCQVKLLAGGQVGDKSSYPVKVTVIDGDLPISTDDCGKYRFN